MAEPVRVVDERRFDPPRLVEVENEGRWWRGLQSAWRLLDDGRGRLAEVTWSQQHEWGLGRYISGIPATRVRLPGADGGGQ